MLGVMAMPMIQTSLSASNLYDIAVKGRLKLDNGSLFSEDAMFGPYLTAGVGFDILDYLDGSKEGLNFLNILLGGGLRWKYNEWFNIGYELTHNLNFNDDYDFDASEDGNDSYLAHQIGMNFTLVPEEVLIKIETGLQMRWTSAQILQKALLLMQMVVLQL